MTDEQGANEIKYRVASLLLLSLLDRSLISVWLLGEICGIEKAAHEKRQSNVVAENVSNTVFCAETPYFAGQTRITPEPFCTGNASAERTAQIPLPDTVTPCMSL